jgi:hypothetical protein
MRIIERFGDGNLIPTRNHSEIRCWAAQHNGVPAQIGVMKFDGAPGILHFLFGDARAGSLDIQPISWEDFFAHFDVLGLSVAYEDSSSRFQIVQVEKRVDPTTFD